MGSGLQRHLCAQVNASVMNILEQLSALISSSLTVIWSGLLQVACGILASGMVLCCTQVRLSRKQSMADLKLGNLIKNFLALLL